MSKNVSLGICLSKSDHLSCGMPEVSNSLGNQYRKIKIWMCHNFLWLNNVRTEILPMGNAKQRTDILSIGGG